MPKFEKVDDANLRVTRKVARIVNVPNLIKGKKELEAQIEIIQEQLKSINEAIAEAKKLGIDVSGKKDEKKKSKN